MNVWLSIHPSTYSIDTSFNFFKFASHKMLRRDLRLTGSKAIILNTVKELWRQKREQQKSLIIVQNIFL